MILNDKFWSKVHIELDNPDGCWPWNAYTNKDGYGQFRLGDKPEKAHRLSFIDFGGILTEDHPLVLHKCNNPPCVNPNHLVAGDLSENAYDSISIGTHSNTNKINCPMGHSLSGDNLIAYDLKRGFRGCRICFNKRPRSK